MVPGCGASGGFEGDLRWYGNGNGTALDDNYADRNGNHTDTTTPALNDNYADRNGNHTDTTTPALNDNYADRNGNHTNNVNAKNPGERQGLGMQVRRARAIRAMVALQRQQMYGNRLLTLPLRSENPASSCPASHRMRVQSKGRARYAGAIGVPKLPTGFPAG